MSTDAESNNRMNIPGDQRNRLEVGPPAPVSEELNALQELGMKREALALASRALKKTSLTTDEFRAALNAVLIFTNAKGWTALVESAYTRLTKLGREGARFDLMDFRHRCGDHEGVIQLMPPPFSGECDHPGMSFAMEALLALGRMELAAEMAGELPVAIEVAKEPLKTMLMQCYAEYLARTNRWDEALAVLEAAQHLEPLSHWAAGSTVEIHVARALLAIQRWFQRSEQFKRGFNPELELSLSGCADEVRRHAVRQLNRAQNILAKIVPKDRQRELGIAKA